MDFKEIGQTIAKRRKELGWSQKELGDKIGAHNQTIVKIERGEIRFSKFLFSIETSLGLPQGSLTGAAGESFTQFAHLRARASNLPTPPAFTHHAAPLASITAGSSFEPAQVARDLVHSLAVYGTALRGTKMVIQPQAIDFTFRPKPLESVRDAYALLWIGESMAPVFEPGDTLLINPHMPSFAGNDVLLRTKDKDKDDATTVCILGRLMGTTEQAYTIREYHGCGKGKHHPRRIDRKDYPICHRVVGKYSR